MVVIGAGPIGCELAQTFQRFGSQVTVITDGAEILPKEDQDAAARVRQQMSQEGVRIVTRGTIQRISSNGSGKRVSVAFDGKVQELECDAILVSVGRTPNLEGLDLERGGVEYTSRGIVVDERLRTTNAKVYAAGDICSRYQFTHAADAMARIVIANALFMARRKVTDLVIPWCTYTDPEIAHVGYYEKDARAAGFDVATITESFSHVDRAVLDGEDGGFARVHYDKKTGRILGGTRGGAPRGRDDRRIDPRHGCETERRDSVIDDPRLSHPGRGVAQDRRRLYEDQADTHSEESIREVAGMAAVILKNANWVTF